MASLSLLFCRSHLAGLCAVLLVGAFLRLPPGLFSGPSGPFRAFATLHPGPHFDQLGFDEGLYRDYTNKLVRFGLGNYPEIVERYREKQETLTGSILPPVRFLYILAAYSWHTIFGTEALQSLKDVSSAFSIFTLLLATLFAWRLGGANYALPVAALMAFAPTQLHMSQHALVDGFFTFWAMLTLWAFWENLRAPRDWRWLLLLLCALVALVLTKENAFFVWVAILALLAANHWLKFGRVTRELVIVIFLGPMIGMLILVLLSGGIYELVATYRLSVTKNYTLPYAVLTGDGPWHRYLVDLLLVSPIVLLLAIGALFNLTRAKKVEWFFAVFITASYLIMCNIKYGMNLRYANMWDMPLIVLAVSQINALFAPLARYRNLLVPVAVAAISVLELRQYIILSVRYPLYELIPVELLHALHILK